MRRQNGGNFTFENEISHQSSTSNQIYLPIMYNKPDQIYNAPQSSFLPNRCDHRINNNPYVKGDLRSNFQCVHNDMRNGNTLEINNIRSKSILNSSEKSLKNNITSESLTSINGNIENPTIISTKYNNKPDLCQIEPIKQQFKITRNNQDSNQVVKGV